MTLLHNILEFPLNIVFSVVVFFIFTRADLIKWLILFIRGCNINIIPIKYWDISKFEIIYKRGYIERETARIHDNARSHVAVPVKNYFALHRLLFLTAIFFIKDSSPIWAIIPLILSKDWSIFGLPLMTSHSMNVEFVCHQKDKNT